MEDLSPSLISLLQASGYNFPDVIDYTVEHGSNLCIIDLSAIEANIKAFRQYLPPGTRMMAMVKAHAYGSDGIRMARFFDSCGIDILSVAYVSEAVALRRAGLTSPLFAINVAPHEATTALEWNLEVGVGNLAAIEALGREAQSRQQTIKLHLHIDTGMRRFGCHPSNALSLAQAIMAHRYLHLEGIMTHFAAADDSAYDDFTMKQISTFDAVIETLTSASIPLPWRHAANSSAALRFRLNQYNMVRLGLALWGFYTSQECRWPLTLTPALNLISQIHEIHLCCRGDTVSYGCNYRVERPEQAIAVLPIGYCDGLHRHYSGKGVVMIRGKLASMAGNICMDYMMVDVTDIPDVQIGDPVLIFGQNQQRQLLPLEGLAQSGNSIAHELIACLGPRIPRIFVSRSPSSPNLNLNLNLNLNPNPNSNLNPFPS